MKIRVADYIARRLADEGTKHVFLVTGGGAMHLNDAFAQESRISPVFNHHEQACAMAAEGYARITNHFAVINVTTGPGGLNALNGVFGAYADSIPMLILSGQVKRETQRSTVSSLGLRQLGDQEVDIVSVVRPITKHVVSLQDPSRVRYELEKAIFLAQSGRPGPVWIDIPVDVQGSLVDVESLQGFVPESALENSSQLVGTALSTVVDSIIKKLSKAKRPVVLVGNGIRLSDGVDRLFQILDRLQVPLCPAWMMDFIPEDYPYFAGIQGTVGDRAGNFVVQNSDFLLILGSRLQIRQVSYNWENFARDAYKVHVDVDAGELNKPTMNSQMKICADLKEFLPALHERLLDYQRPPEHQSWLEWALSRKAKYHPVIQDRHRNSSGAINPYHFFETLSEQLDHKWNVVAGNASACVMSFPTMKLKAGQRMFTNAGSASMGYDLPASMGAALADPSRRTLCLAGDGSIMMNLQELQTVYGLNLELKIIVINNNGYLSIRSTQSGFFGRRYGESAQSGVSLPSFATVGRAFGIDSIELKSSAEMAGAISRFLSKPGPGLMEVFVDEAQPFEPKLSSKKDENGKMTSAPLEDMWPFLERDEFMDNMLVEPLKVSRS